MGDVRFAVACCVHDDHWFLGGSLRSFSSLGGLFAFVGKVPWNGAVGDWEAAVGAAREAGATVVLGEWPDERVHRWECVRRLYGQGYTHVVFPDTDEVASPELVESLKKIAEAGLAQRVYVHMDTYWRHPDCVIRPRERLTPLIMLEAGAVVPVDTPEYNGRLFQGGKGLVLPPEYGVLHHLSYVGPEERILRKTSTWSHSHEVLQGWFEGVYRKWDRDRTMRNLHPTHPEVYGFVERIAFPKELEGVTDHLAESAAKMDISKPEGWPGVSVVVPLYGGEDDIRFCLETLEESLDLLVDVVVVDDVSPDGAAEVAEGFPFVRLIRREKNGGFSAACNQGVEACEGEVVVLLNSDAAMPRAALLRLVETLVSDRSVGAAGPVSNNVGYFQQVSLPMTGLGALSLAAADYAVREEPDEAVSMLVGFCLAVRKEDYLSLGGLDTGFGNGTFEDTDFCYRLQREGRRLLVSRRAFVYHKGSQSLQRLPEHPAGLLKRNQSVFRAKWREDLEAGFASHLAGDRREPVRFDASRRPDLLRERFAGLARAADVSLCMIVRDEERVVGDCLASVEGVFSQVVVVDTGSADRTKEIVLEHGAELYETEWPMSFSAARNESLKHAKGKWVMWMDADDTLPRWCAERILFAAAGAPEDVTAFIVPVQFVEGGRPSGTRVDHVKLFRNLPGIEFEGRIHEQVLPSIRRVGGRVERIDAYVLHSGYDTSEGGQAKKRKRDTALLELDLQERPGHPFVLFNLGMTAHYNGEHEEAARWLEQSVAAAGPGESHVRKAYALWGGSLMHMGDLAGATEVFGRGLVAVQGDPELRFHLARCLTEAGRLSEARLEYERMPGEPGGEFSSLDVGIFGFKRLFNLATVCKGLGDRVAANRYFEAALLDSPEPAVALEFYRFAMEGEDFGRARFALGHLMSMATFEAWADGWTGLFRARGEDAAAGFEGMYRRDASRIEPLLAFGRELLTAGAFEEGMRVLEGLAAHGCPQAAFYQGVALAQRGMGAAALSKFRETLALDPGHELSRAMVQQMGGGAGE